MYKKFIENNWLFVLNDIFKDYLGTQFFPSKFLCNDNYDLLKIKNIYSYSFVLNNINNLYIHIPFCKTRCYYCHCFTYVSDKFIEDYDLYTDYLIKNIDFVIWNSNSKIKLNSIYIWWWTPNIVWAKNLNKLFKYIFSVFDLSSIKQFNIDINPYLLDDEIFTVFKEYNVTRVTYAIQSFNKSVLDLNSRYNKKIDHFYNINLFHKLWIKVNIDLMIWIKGQTLDICKSDILKSIDLNVDNISLNYFIQSDNVSYQIDDEKKYLISQVKKYFNKVINYKYNKSYNEQEETYLRSNINLIWIWNWAITHLNSNLIGYNNFELKNYYENIDSWIYFSNLKYLDRQIELIKYLFFNLVFWVEISYIENNYWWFLWLEDKMSFLYDNNILINNWYKIYSNVNNFKLYLYLTILLYDHIEHNNYLNTKPNKISIIINLNKFFLQNWEKVDEDY